jgi:hypothetical protein
VEQRLARQAHNLEVVGSIPTGAIFVDHRSDTLNPLGAWGYFDARAEKMMIITAGSVSGRPIVQPRGTLATALAAC